MATEAEPTLAGEFPPATEEQWLALVDKVLKGAPLSRLQSSTAGGITVEPLYTEATSPGADDKSGFPGAAPFTRGSSAEPRPDGAWGIRTLLSTPDPIEANKTALRELERGSTELLVRFDAAFRAGFTQAIASLRNSEEPMAYSLPRPRILKHFVTACIWI